MSGVLVLAGPESCSRMMAQNNWNATPKLKLKGSQALNFFIQYCFRQRAHRW